MSSETSSIKGVKGGLAAALVLAAGIGGAALARNGWAAEPKGSVTTAGTLSAPAANIEARTNVLAEIENGFIAIAEKVEPSIVSIRTRRTLNVGPRGGFGPNIFQIPDMGDDDGPSLPRSFRNRGSNEMKVEGSGSGVIVRSDGWILTNDHVVAGAEKVTVKLHDGRELEGTVRRDYRSDLALVKVDASGLPTAEFADSSKVKVGQWAVAFGSPFALDDTVTVGIISARARQKFIQEDGQARFYPSLLQTDAAINRGNSGGPLVDSRGRIIGINVAINSPNGGSVGIAFAIPSNTAKDVMEQLITKGKVVRGFMGITPRALTADERSRYNVKSGGAIVSEVATGTPADTAGLQPEDIVLQYNGNKVEDDISLREMIGRSAPGSRATVVVLRGGREQTITVTLGEPREMGVPGADRKSAEPAAGGKLGVRVENLTPETARKFNVKGASEGAVVVEVAPGSPAAEAGLAPGTVIVRISGRPVRNTDDLAAAMKDIRSGTISLVVVAGEGRRLVNVEL
jgi:serine protease Do